MTDLPLWLHQALTVSRFLLPYALGFAFCLWGINWQRLRPILVGGAWVPLSLLIVLVALVWSQIAPHRLELFGFFTAPNFWWQLVSIALLAGVGLFAGWLQDRYSWTPQEVEVEPPAHAHGHNHSHGHDHDHPHDHGHVAIHSHDHAHSAH